MTIDRYPETPAQLFDLLHERFGLGEYDELANPSAPWWKERNTGIAKLKAMMRKRCVNEKQLAVAAWYASAQNIPIRFYAELVRLVPEAMRQLRIAEQVTARKNARSGLDAAIAEALALGEHEWAERMLRVDSSEADNLLREWQERAHG